MRKGVTIKQATERWVSEMNRIYQSMIEKLIRLDPCYWHEITKPSYGNRVYFYGDTCENGYGEISEIKEDSKGVLYVIELDCEETVEARDGEFEVEYDDMLPMWVWMWSFDDSADDYWLEELDGIRIMSECGFRIYEHEGFGYFFGIDGCGYDFYEAHWIPLYKARGLQWHDEVAEHRYQMERKGYKVGKLGTNKYWMDGDQVVEEVLRGELDGDDYD